jgi:DNA-binding NtrC family response regulator
MKSKTVLIACQEGLCAGSLMSFLNGSGYGVETPETVSEIIQTTRNEAVHVVLLNEEIEGVRACDLVPLFKKINGTIQVIVISSEVPLGPAKRLRGAGIFYHAMKPVDLEEIKSAVKCACEKK